ncbi:hypothetical protein B2A_09447, partial [mine drainage metagenome]
TVRALLADPPSRDATRAYAERFGWEETSAGQFTLFDTVIAERARRETRCGKSHGSHGGNLKQVGNG